MDERYLEIQALLKKKLKKERYEHTLGVMYTAASLAMCHSANLHQAMLAGLLHDCGKYGTSKEQIEQCKEKEISLTDAELMMPSLVHAKLGAYLAEYEYGIADGGILSAIRFHTTGRPEMTLLEKIIYIADYIEPMRYKASRLPEIRKLAFEDLDECMYEILKDTLEYLEEDSADDIEPTSKEAYIYYKELHNKRNNVSDN